MQMRLYDTHAQAVRDFRAGHTVRLYVCGITPYDSAHLGHAFTYVAFDVLSRFLEHQGHRVLLVRNVTDVAVASPPPPPQPQNPAEICAPQPEAAAGA